MTSATGGEVAHTVKDLAETYAVIVIGAWPAGSAA